MCRMPSSFSCADLAGADLEGANLGGVRYWSDINSIRLANVYEVRNLPEGFLWWAIENGAVSLESKEEWQPLKNKENLDERGTSP